MQCSTSFFINVDKVINFVNCIDTVRQWLSTPFDNQCRQSPPININNAQNHPTLATQVSAGKSFQPRFAPSRLAEMKTPQ